MALEGWYVKQLCRKDITTFIEQWHYSKSINGCISDFCFGLFNTENQLVGAMFYGRMAMANQWNRFADKQENVIELRRLCCIDETPKNAESFFIARSIKLLKKLWGGSVIVSYADKEFGHSGTIYKASNFKKLADIKGSKVIVFGDRTYHDKSVRTKYKGELKPFALRLIRALVDGSAYYKPTAGKSTYIYELKVRKPVQFIKPAIEHGRNYLGCELNPEYENLQLSRIVTEKDKIDSIPINIFEELEWDM